MKFIKQTRMVTMTVMIVFGLVIGATEPARALVFSVVYHFTPPPDGGHPFTGLTRDAAGNFYGTTELGSTSDSGTIFKIDPTGIESVLYSFTGGAGAYLSQAELTLDSAGNVYGTATSDGTS
jgi:uncharacterized repeat protein (TIGR03803 family)